MTTDKHERPALRLRDRLFPLLTVTAAALLFYATQYYADDVGTNNLARAVGAFMFQPMLTPRGSAPVDPAMAAPTAQEISRQVGTAEVIIHAWRWSMWGVCGLLWLLSLIAVITGRPRAWQLLAAALIFLSTLCTLVALYLIIHPGFGAMPPLAWKTYALVAVVQSIYGWILLFAYAKRSTAPRFGEAMAGS